MLTSVTLPVFMALSWTPVRTPATNPTPTSPSSNEETISCPLTGEEIPACCCPVKK